MLSARGISLCHVPRATVLIHVLSVLYSDRTGKSIVFFTMVSIRKMIILPHYDYSQFLCILIHVICIRIISPGLHKEYTRIAQKKGISCRKEASQHLKLYVFISAQKTLRSTKRRPERTQKRSVLRNIGEISPHKPQAACVEMNSAKDCVSRNNTTGIPTKHMGINRIPLKKKCPILLSRIGFDVINRIYTRCSPSFQSNFSYLFTCWY